MPTETVKELSMFIIILCIFLAGPFGGLLYGAQRKKIKFPSMRGGEIDLGVINDILFGFGGGFLIFLVIPEFPNTNESWGVVKLLSLAITGGYSGRALVEKVSNELELKVNRLQEISDYNQKAYKMFSEIIDGKAVEDSIIKDTIKNASHATILKGFALLNDRRKALVFKIFDNCNAPEEQIVSIRNQFDPLIPLLTELIEYEKQQDENEINSYLHYHYASLAYLYKDKERPEWGKVIENINKSIDLYSKAHGKIHIPETYMLNKLISNINLNDKKEADLCFEKLWEIPGGRYEIIRSKSIITPRLHDWIIENYAEKIKKEFSDNKQYDEYKCNWNKLFSHSCFCS